MDQNVVVATAATIIAALLGLIGTLLGMVHKNAKKAAIKTDVLVDNVQNSHSKNMRDDLDEKFRGLFNLITGQSRDLGGMKEDIRLIRRDQGEDRAEVNRAITAAHFAADEARRAAQLAQEALNQSKHERD